MSQELGWQQYAYMKWAIERAVGSGFEPSNARISSMMGRMTQTLNSREIRARNQIFEELGIPLPTAGTAKLPNVTCPNCNHTWKYKPKKDQVDS
tara:strand:+ start:2121 stop:2402 length:282 start_codon:yes stop_codon:yes gene_type:complete